MFHVVSIHALLAECDCMATVGQLAGPCFNPRTPCGVRPNRRGRLDDSHRLFQSTHSLRSATKYFPFCLRLGPFQSTHSLRSATIGWLVKFSAQFVSIHALLAECDATDFIHYYSTEQIILCANLPKKTVIARLHFLSIYLSIFYSQCITPIADLPGNSCELEVGAQAMFHSL